MHRHTCSSKRIIPLRYLNLLVVLSTFRYLSLLNHDLKVLPEGEYWITTEEIIHKRNAHFLKVFSVLQIIRDHSNLPLPQTIKRRVTKRSNASKDERDASRTKRSWYAAGSAST